MKKRKEVSINKLAFIACKGLTAIFLWFALFLKIKWLVAANVCILLTSALFKIERAPLISLFSPITRKINSKTETVDESGIVFAQSFGAVVHLIAVVFLYFGSLKTGWVIVLFLAILKTASVFGFCSGLKIYECMSKRGCCSLLKRKDG